MTRIYTKTGDRGETSLFGGKRISKDSLRVETYGTIDELNSALGVAASQIGNVFTRDIIFKLQNDLFNLGSELALAKEKKLSWAKKTQELEKIIDDLDSKLPELRNFILPGGDKGASLLQLARSICRRAERRLVSLSKKEDVNHDFTIYLNRLSDLLFVLSRYTNKTKNTPEILWKK